MAQAALALSIVAAAAGGARYLTSGDEAGPPRQRAEPIYAVRVQEVELADHAPIIRAFGNVSARRTVEMRTLVPGTVVEVHPDLLPGAYLEAGEVLVRVDPFSYEGAVVEARANLAEAQARVKEGEALLQSERSTLRRVREQVEISRRNLERAQSLRERGATSAQQLDEARLNLSQREELAEARESAVLAQEARIEQQRATVERLAWALRQAERDLEETEVRAPFDAVVRSESVEVGRRLVAGDVVADLYDPQALDVSFTLSNGQYGRLVEGEAGLIGHGAEVSWNVGGSAIEAPATVTRVAADVTPERGGVEVLARIETERGVPRLKPGAFVAVELSDRLEGAVAVLPETSLYSDQQGGNHVFAVVQDAGDAELADHQDGDGRLVRREVELVAYEGADVLVRGAGDDPLASGESVVTTRLIVAGEGVRVRPVEDGALEAPPDAPEPAAEERAAPAEATAASPTAGASADG